MALHSYKLLRTKGCHVDGYEESPVKKEITSAATLTVVHAVLLNADLLEQILVGELGVWGFQQVAMVCKAWLDVTRSSFPLLRSVALYKGGLSRPELYSFLALRKHEIRRLGGGAAVRTRNHATLEVFGPQAIEKALVGGVEAFVVRLKARAAAARWSSWPPCGQYCLCTRSFCANYTHRQLDEVRFETEEDKRAELHRDASHIASLQRRRWGQASLSFIEAASRAV